MKYIIDDEDLKWWLFDSHNGSDWDDYVDKFLKDKAVRVEKIAEGFTLCNIETDYKVEVWNYDGKVVDLGEALSRYRNKIRIYIEEI